MALKTLIAAGTLLPLSFCNPQPAPTTPPAEILCRLGQPPIEAADQFSAAHARWVLTVLKTGMSLCGWSAPGGGK